MFEKSYRKLHLNIIKISIMFLNRKRNKGYKPLFLLYFSMVRLTGIEPVTLSLGNYCSILLRYRHMYTF